MAWYQSLIDRGHPREGYRDLATCAKAFKRRSYVD
jgi:hypothetical protein